MLHGKATLDEYTLENVKSSQVKELMDRIHCVEDPELENEFPKKWPASVNLVAKDSRQFSARIDYPKGDPENPLSWDELIDKFKNLISQVFSRAKQDKIIDRVRSMEQEDDVNSFSMLLLKD
jgi:2-methylcitrate dehydratase PrpD